MNKTKQILILSVLFMNLLIMGCSSGNTSSLENQNSSSGENIETTSGYQVKYDEYYNSFINLRMAELIPLGLTNIYDDENNPSLEKAKSWCEENFVKMENISREANGLEPLTQDEYNGSIDGCADAFMAKA